MFRWMWLGLSEGGCGRRCLKLPIGNLYSRIFLREKFLDAFCSA